MLVLNHVATEKLTVSLCNYFIKIWQKGSDFISKYITKSKIRTYIPWKIQRITATLGEGNGKPLQYSCLENPMDGGAWWAAVHWVAKSWTRLSDFTFTFHFHALEKAMATHSSVLAWKIPGTEEAGGLPSLGSHRVGHDWCDLAAAQLHSGGLAGPSTQGCCGRWSSIPLKGPLALSHSLLGLDTTAWTAVPGASYPLGDSTRSNQVTSCFTVPGKSPL